MASFLSRDFLEGYLHQQRIESYQPCPYHSHPKALTRTENMTPQLPQYDDRSPPAYSPTPSSASSVESSSEKVTVKDFKGKMKNMAKTFVNSFKVDESKGGYRENYIWGNSSSTTNSYI